MNKQIQIKTTTMSKQEKIKQLVADLGWDYDRLSTGGQSVYNEICDLLDIQTSTFTILEKKMYDWHTEYQIGFKGKSYKCVRNARYPKLEGVKLSECEQYELGELLEKDFLNDCI